MNQDVTTFGRKEGSPLTFQYIRNAYTCIDYAHHSTKEHHKHICNRVEPAIDFPVSASDSDFVLCNNFKIENSVKGSSSLDRIGEPTNGF